MKKIFNLEELKKKISAEKKKGKKIVHCHGVFDLLHVGHIKHFKSAKKSGDFLLVVRPEKAFLADKKIKGSNYFVGKLVDSIFQGESQLLVVKLNSDDDDGHEVRVRVPNESVTQKALPLVGENVTIGLKVADSYVVS